jgi:2-methylcitrate dehydratase PrpD
VGTGKATSPELAALANGAAMHSQDFMDTYLHDVIRGSVDRRRLGPVLGGDHADSSFVVVVSP